MSFLMFFFVVLLTSVPAQAQQCQPDEVATPVQVAGKWELRCVRQVPRSTYPEPKALPAPTAPNPKSLRGGANSESGGGWKTGHLALPTPKGTADQLVITISDAHLDGEIVPGPTVPTGSTVPYWNCLKGTVSRAKQEGKYDQFLVTEMKHDGEPWVRARAGLYVILQRSGPPRVRSTSTGSCD